MRKSIRLALSKMTFGDAPLKTERGDIYPVLLGEGEFSDICCEGEYVFTPNASACCARLIGNFNPYSTYDIAVSELCEGGKVGIYLSYKNGFLALGERVGEKMQISALFGGKTYKFGEAAYSSGMHLMFTFHEGSMFDAYTSNGSWISEVGSIVIDECLPLRTENVFASTDAALYVEGNSQIRVSSLENYLDCGIMQADCKPVKYEDGTVLVENGKIYITYSARFGEEKMQQIASYDLSTCEIKLVGAMLFDSGDGAWCGDVGSSVVYDRNTKTWRVLTVVFSHGHRLAYAELDNDVRFGINVIDVTPIEFTDDPFKFGATKGDEDPDMLYDKEEGCWYLTVCRLDPEAKNYRYYLFKSSEWTCGYEFVSYTDDTVETTGGSFVKFNGATYFVFGRSFSENGKYDVREFPSMKKLGELNCNHSDGGFRGWGSVFEIPCGTRKRLLWLTFDRTLGSSFNWSYGNIYVFESETMKLK